MRPTRGARRRAHTDTVTPPSTAGDDSTLHVPAGSNGERGRKNTAGHAEICGGFSFWAFGNGSGAAPHPSSSREPRRSTATCSALRLPTRPGSLIALEPLKAFSAARSRGAVVPPGAALVIQRPEVPMPGIPPRPRPCLHSAICTLGASAWLKAPPDGTGHTHSPVEIWLPCCDKSP